MSHDDEGNLMSRVQAGDDRAFDALMIRWEVRLRRFAQRYLHNEHDAMDVAQETFVRAYRHRENFRAGAKFSTWLFSIALNLCRDRARRCKGRPLLFLDENELALAADQSRDDTANAPDAEAIRAETARAVRTAVHALPEPLKSAILLCEFEQFSHAEAAGALGCTPKAVETRLYRARAHLREALAAFL